jgi:hypothetical protein
MKFSISAVLSFIVVAIALPADEVTEVVAEPEALPSAVYLYDSQNTTAADEDVHIFAEGTFQAFTNAGCTSGGGSVISFSTAVCINTPGRHYYKITGCRTGHLVWTQSNCRGTYVSVTANPGCYPVNTGLSWGSSTVQCA